MKKRLLAKLPGVTIFEVDGPEVRRKNVVFIEGGHGEVYSFVPKNEIWVEKMRNRQDQDFVAVHEILEFHLMRDKRLSYNRAHDAANKVEQRLRREFPARRR